MDLRQFILLATIVAASGSFAAEPTTITNSIGMQLVEIPSGEFVMGSDESAADLQQALRMDREPLIEGERPAHKVRITKPLYLGKYEVTVGEFRKFVEATGYKTDAETNGVGGNGFTGKAFTRRTDFNWQTWWKEQTDRHPVVEVSWNDSVAFCDWLSKTEKAVYRLPTEAEWEYACRAGTTTRYSCGDDPAGLEKIANVADAKEHPPGTVLTTTVGSFAPNAFGLYDMHGNVFEWCADRYQTDVYEKSPTDDPPPPTNGANAVVRGGCWGFAMDAFRSARRGRIAIGNCGYRDGLRVVREK